MKRKEFIGGMMLGSLGLAGADSFGGDFLKHSFALNEKEPRSRMLFDRDWRFQLGDITHGQMPGLNDLQWKEQNLPHDWSIYGSFSKNNSSGWHQGYLPGGIGWYRKTFPWNHSWKGRKVYIDFDGIYMNSDVWINGHHLGNRPYGFISFRYDLTPYLRKGKNVIAVRVNNANLPNARWYTGSGINRHVWLNTTNLIHINNWGTFLRTPQISGDQAHVRIQTNVKNDYESNKGIIIEQVVNNQQGKAVAQTSKRVTLKSESNTQINQGMQVRYPNLWSPDNPYLYDVITTIKDSKNILDQYHTQLGIRKLAFSPEWGFRINGEDTLIKGVADHECGGGAVGSAIPDEQLYRRLKLLKKMGCNAIRTAHNPRRPQFYAFCDVLGLMVLNEFCDGWGARAKYDYGLYFEDWWKTDLTSFIQRDRNHPCVIMWSIGNEVRDFTYSQQKELVDLVHEFDPTRAVTQGGSGRGKKGHYLDVVGFNGYGEEKNVLQNYHKKNPARPVIGTEMTHTLQTRDVYHTQSWYRERYYPLSWHKGQLIKKLRDTVHRVPNLSEKEIFTGTSKDYLSSYDNAIVRINVRDQFKHDSQYSFLMGSFRWTGFDYLGEATFGWPTRATDFGIIDLGGFPKDHYFLYQSLWNDKPMVHLLPHWTYPGKEGQKIPIVAYSNCEKVELFLNGKSLGEQSVDETLQLVWQVSYQPGELIAYARNSNGLKLAEASRQTAGSPSAIQVHIDRTTLRANEQDIARLEVSIVDKKGITVPDAANWVQLVVEGPGKLLGVENGDIADLHPTKTNRRKAFHGKCMGLIQAVAKTGLLTVKAKSKNLKSEVLNIRVI